MGNTYYQPDKAIERWAHMRENTHLTFKWNARNIRYGLVWGIAVPLIIYFGTVAEFVRADAASEPVA